MPIRFRCAYCNQLMSIARRKAGTVVSCPTCGGQVIVPPEQAPAAPPQPKPVVFDQPNFEQVFQQPAAPPNKVTGQMPSASQQPAPGGYPLSVDVEPIPLPGQLEGQGCLLTTGKMILLGIIVLLLLALAFVAGLLIGRSSVGGVLQPAACVRPAFHVESTFACR